MDTDVERRCGARRVKHSLYVDRMMIKAESRARRRNILQRDERE